MLVRDPEDDRRGWEWYVLDSERIHQDIVHILINESPEFCRALLGHSGKCRCEPHLFDLVVRSGAGSQTYVELKVDGRWSDYQRRRQVAHLRQTPGARGVLLLFSQRAVEFSRDRIKALVSDEIFTKVSYAELYRALDVISGEPALHELAATYKLALQDQEARTKDIHGDPNL